MRLIQYIRRLTDEQLVAWAKRAAVSSAVVAGLLLFLLGFFLSFLNLDENFNYVSSFLEVMIAADASCSFKIVGDWLKRHRHEFLAENILTPTTLANGAMEEAQMNRIAPMHSEMSRIYDYIDSRVGIVGIWFAGVATLMLVVGFKDWMRPYAVIAAYPLVAYVMTTFVTTRFWELVYARACGIAAGDELAAPQDDAFDFSQVIGCTGPVP